ncbi:MAG: bifunctional (p)ppGpp synthetase/guanosine-3',5'-bis(diphosphate) 3'-pyrophosphohydrolase [Bacteroidales bacterium]|jgi:GTP pyrophosphokinase|nr:bifunctional (p)ppGpp synthetase/guanosine-3',5'-bis(diphosphate) 3'-pyrophosphohydrolase [Bacteroidales bacterium]MBP8678084.1 bifunctional (p)ppGpp synthetase/guanosine-3',5'-bis(diphosphate) 3'-pyrophosphohydrolase [Bacteroidales bacterium]MBP9583730.1 bifunctional (p)ppGpp synthetase/guanosine-3',5'-bis(diphosphate) 3'-pyrophosphohydrolase [Bacteroidales bacterium]MBP9978055.1 bifunctional (p)ppGpp synthetase/guanosine-3',5'-bis(diphosphate) 3'-pyrophosphohydrolase [Bacteroidales bacteriu
MFTDKDNELIDREFEELRLASLKRCANQSEYEIVLKAFEFARAAHNGVRRRSGEPYILHPISVAKIVVQEIGLGYKSIVSALLHDVVEDTEYNTDDIERLFGAKIASLVDGLTKIKSAFDSGTSSQAENFKRILLTLNDDVRVILIKLADRLHNMRTIEYMPEHKRSKILSETMYIFIPLAHRLGLYSIKSELENIWLMHTLPSEFESIQIKISQTIAERGIAMDSFMEPISESLKKAGYEFSVSKRTKSPYSIWRKMNAKSIPFEQIYDLYAVRIIFEAKEDQPERIQCWHIYSLITEIYLSKTDRIRDWVSTPKINGYEALHCTVMGPQGNWIEVQIRSSRMNDLAERGVAAHWNYKGSSPSEGDMDKWLNLVREVLENPDVNALEFLDKFHTGLLSSEIYVFTPKGESRALPKGATALDFAYAIHTEVGNKAIAAKANFKLVPLTYELRNGDQIEIITAESQRPQRDWLEFIVTPKAKGLILDALKSEIKDSQKKGQEILDERLKGMGIKPQSRVYRKLSENYKLNNREELFSKIGANIIDLTDLSKVLKKNTTSKFVRYWSLQFSKITGGDSDGSVEWKGEEELSDESSNLNPAVKDEKRSKIDIKKDFLLRENPIEKTLSYQVATCCRPIPGDKVIGFIDDNDIVIVHKNSCPEAIHLAARDGDRIVKAKWSKHTVLSFLARINMRGIDRLGILNELTQYITLVLSVNIRKIFIETHDGIFEGYIDLYVHSVEDLDKLMKQMSSVKGVMSVVRSEIKDNQ